MAKEDPQNSQGIDVTDAENHSSVQVSEVRLYSSNLTPLLEETEDKSSKIAFHISAVIDGRTAFCKLNVEMIYAEEIKDVLKTGYCLDFNLIGVITGSDRISSRDMAEFAKMFTLSLLWPYAREYASDQLRRTGLPLPSLPVINPQVVTEKLIRGNFIQVQINNETKE